MNSQGHIYAIYQIFDKIIGAFEEKAKTNPNASIAPEVKKQFRSIFEPFFDSDTTKSEQSERINRFVREIRRDNRGNFIYKRVLRSKLQKAKVDNCEEIVEELKPEDIKGIVFSEQKFIETCQALKDAGVIDTVPQLGNLDLNAIKTEINNLFQNKDAEDLVNEISDDKVMELIDEESSSDDDAVYDDTEKAEIVEKKKEELREYIRGLNAWNGKKERLESKSFKDIQKDEKYSDNVKKKLLEDCVLILKTKEECDIRLRLREMRYLSFLEQIGAKDGDSDKYRNLLGTIKNHVLTQNEIVESFNNLKACIKLLPDTSLESGCNDTDIERSGPEADIREFSDPEIRIEDYITKGLVKIKKCFNNTFVDGIILDLIEDEIEKDDFIKRVLDPKENETAWKEVIGYTRDHIKKNLKIAQTIMDYQSIDRKRIKESADLQNQDVFIIPNERIEEYGRMRTEIIAKEAEIKLDDQRPGMMLLIGSIAPDLFTSPLLERHHFPRTRPMSERQKDIQLYKERLWNYFSRALNHAIEYTHTSDKDKKQYEFLRALYDFGVFAHYYLDALIKRTEYDSGNNETNHTKIDDDLYKTIRNVCEQTGNDCVTISFDFRPLFSGRPNEESITGRIEERVTGLINSSDSLFRSCQQKSRGSSSDEAKVKLAIENLCQVGGIILYALNRNWSLAQDSVAEEKNIFAKALSLITKLVSSKKFQSQLYPVWAIESTLPDDLSFHHLTQRKSTPKALPIKIMPPADEPLPILPSGTTTIIPKTKAEKKVVLRNKDGSINWNALGDSSIWVDILQSVPANPAKCSEVPKYYRPEQRRGLKKTLEDMNLWCVPGGALNDGRYAWLRWGLFLEACGEPEAADYCYDELRRLGGICLRKAVDREKFER